MNQNRLAVIGSKAKVRLFRHSDWERVLGARYVELLENAPGRFAVQFQTRTLPVQRLRLLSRKWPGLVFLLDCENEEHRCRLLAKANAGQVEQWSTEY